MLRRQRAAFAERLTQAEQRGTLWEGSYEVERMRTTALREELAAQKVAVARGKQHLAVANTRQQRRTQQANDDAARAQVCIYNDEQWRILHLK